MAGTKEIKLSNSDIPAIVDEDDYEHIIQLGPWYRNEGGYAVRRSKQRTIRMHRVIAKPSKFLHVDHINGDRLDNRRINLRVATAAINAQNSEVDRHQKYDLPRYVTWDYQRNAYVATFTKRKRFKNLDEAIKFTKDGS